MVIAAVAGWLAVTQFNADLSLLFTIIALSAFVYGAITVAVSFGMGRSNRLPISTKT